MRVHVADVITDRLLRIFHYSDDGAIVAFSPRPVRVPSERPRGEEWLNGPLVWAVDEAHEFTYLFPRDTARIVLWSTPRTTEQDRERWLNTSDVVAYVEREGLREMTTAKLYRYELPHETFVPTSEPWMLVSREPVTPIGVTGSLTSLLD